VRLRRHLLVVAALALAAAPAFAHDWNETAIAWKGLDDGLALAKAEGKPVCLIVYTEWCPHCGNYSKVFHDPKVVEKAKRFVMVRLDQDKEKARTGAYAPDGGYIPRTMFLAPDGILAADVHAPRPKYQYFYDENDPASVLAGMDAALAKLAPAKPEAAKPDGKKAGPEKRKP
jgi:protein-disulfide reductase (glutathione)